MKRRPNILHFFLDQMRYDAIAAHGNRAIATPNIDKLVQNGVSFTNAYSPSPVCIAARCSMIFGQYPSNTGCYENTGMPTDGRDTFMQALTASGYCSHGIGKCHFTPDPDALRGFSSRESQEELRLEPKSDEYLSYLHSHGYKYICDPHGVRGDMYYIPQVSQLPQEYHPSHWIGDRSIRFIRDRSGKDDPWYLFSSFVHPHPPFSPPNPWHKLYQSALLNQPNLPADGDSLLTYVNRVQNRYKYRDRGIDYNLVQVMKAYYYSCVSFIDFQIGRIVSELEKTKQLEQTVIVFTADHGEYLGDYNCFGKRGMHDASAKIPLIISNPERFPSDKRCDTPVSLVDIAPTILDVSGTAIDTHECDGTSLQAVLEKNNEDRDVFSQHSYQPVVNLLKRTDAGTESSASDDSVAEWMVSMIVNKKWKYFYSAPDEREFLFDKRIDVSETQNKAGLRFTDSIVRELRNRLFTFLEANEERALVADGRWITFPKKDIPVNIREGLLIQDHPWARTHIKGYTKEDIDFRIYDTGIGDRMK
jgi:arylsulfatase A-like enzyme